MIYFIHCPTDKKIEYGRGTGSTRDGATEHAAQQVLVALRGDYDNMSEQQRPHTESGGDSSGYPRSTAADQATQPPYTLDSAGTGSHTSHFRMTLNNWLQG